MSATGGQTRRVPDATVRAVIERLHAESLDGVFWPQDELDVTLVGCAVLTGPGCTAPLVGGPVERAEVFVDGAPASAGGWREVLRLQNGDVSVEVHLWTAWGAGRVFVHGAEPDVSCAWLDETQGERPPSFGETERYERSVRAWLETAASIGDAMAAEHGELEQGSEREAPVVVWRSIHG